MAVAVFIMPVEISSHLSSNGFGVVQPICLQKMVKGLTLFRLHSLSSQLDCHAKIKYFARLLVNLLTPK